MVGFKVVISDLNNSGSKRNIRSICPLVDTPDCDDSTTLTPEFRDMEAQIDEDLEPDVQLLEVDYMSKYYGALDGYSFCSD